MHILFRTNAPIRTMSPPFITDSKKMLPTAHKRPLAPLCRSATTLLGSTLQR